MKNIRLNNCSDRRCAFDRPSYQESTNDRCEDEGIKHREMLSLVLGNQKRCSLRGVKWEIPIIQESLR